MKLSCVKVVNSENLKKADFRLLKLGTIFD